MIVEVYVRDKAMELALLAKAAANRHSEVGLSMSDVQSMVMMWHRQRETPGHCEISWQPWWKSWGQIHG